MSVYFAQAGGYVKIGYSADPISRVSTITTNGKRPADLPRGADATLIGWVPGNRQTEIRYLARFMDDHVAGEWYYIEPTVVRAAIWEDPHGVDLARMSATAVFAAIAYPEMTRDELERAGVRVEGVTIDESLAAMDARLVDAFTNGPGQEAS